MRTEKGRDSFRLAGHAGRLSEPTCHVGHAMPPGGFVYHVLHRRERRPIRIRAYCRMPNPWHCVWWPAREGPRTAFGRWYAHDHTSGSGHLHQGRFKAFPIAANRPASGIGSDVPLCGLAAESGSHDTRDAGVRRRRNESSPLFRLGDALLEIARSRAVQPGHGRSWSMRAR